MTVSKFLEDQLPDFSNSTVIFCCNTFR